MLAQHITIGYNTNNSREDPWEVLKDEARKICNDPEMIEQETHRVIDITNRIVPRLETDDIVQDYCSVYSKPFGSHGHPIKIIEMDQQIMQMVSTSADLIKYEVRRAFVRLLLFRMHKQGIEINIETI